MDETEVNMTPLSVVRNIEDTRLPGFTETSDPMMRGRISAIGVLPQATVNDRPAVFVTITLEDDTTVVGSTTLTVLAAAVGALAAAHGVT